MGLFFCLLGLKRTGFLLYLLHESNNLHAMMNRKLSFLLGLAALLFSPPPAWSQDSLVVDIWEGVPSPDRPQARLHVFLPGQGAAPARSVLILPGGGYAGLAMGHEGTDWAGFFCPRGVAACVLEYRLPAGQCEVPLADVRRALEVMREKAAGWGLAPEGIGIMGSSAGGHLAATAVAWLPASERPAFQILFYPVVTMDETYTHHGSRENLLGKSPSPALVYHYSLEHHVEPSFPPTFIAFSGDDKVVSPRNALQYYAALLECGVSASLHAYPGGGHGWGYRGTFAWHGQVVDELGSWLDSF